MKTNNRGATPTERKAPTKDSTTNKNNKKKPTPVSIPAERSNLQVWIAHHKLALTNSLDRIKQSPIPTILTILVVGVALALPAALQVVIKNLEATQESLTEQSQITLFIKSTTHSLTINTLVEELQAKAEITEVEFIPAAKAWSDFKQSTGLENADSVLDHNPLPPTIIVKPSLNASAENIEKLSQELQEIPSVEMAKVDMLWIQRLYSVVDFIKYTSIAISIFLIFTVLIVIGNTIKMLGQNFHDEIIVSKLVGASDGYVRRPFLYSGIIYGFSGAICAIFFVFIGILLLLPKLTEIAMLYQTELNLAVLGINDIFSLLLIGIILGLGGAWISANRLINSMPL